MNALAAIAPDRATPLGKTFATWTLGDRGEQRRHDLRATTLDEAIAEATPPVMAATLAKGGFPAFVILETDETACEGAARQVLHLFTVKVRKEFRRIGDDVFAKQAAVPIAVKQGSLPMQSFEPRRPFDALRDNPVTGLQPGEGRLIDVSALA